MKRRNIINLDREVLEKENESLKVKVSTLEDDLAKGKKYLRKILNPIMMPQ